MESRAQTLASAEIETVRRALKATVEGSFFPDWEFETLFGIDRETVREVYGAWPNRTIGKSDFKSAVIGALNNLTGYPHGKDDELMTYVPEGRAAIINVLERLSSLRI